MLQLFQGMKKHCATEVNINLNVKHTLEKHWIFKHLQKDYTVSAPPHLLETPAILWQYSAKIHSTWAELFWSFI